MTHEINPRSALQVIAIFEATKGLAALAGLIGVLDLLHHDALNAFIVALNAAIVGHLTHALWQRLQQKTRV